MQNKHIQSINTYLKELAQTNDIRSGIAAAQALLSYAGVDEIIPPDDAILTALKLPNAERYDRWFQQHPHFKSSRACFSLNIIATGHVEAKLYTLQKKSRMFISGSVHFTPNYEDALYTRQNKDSKIGIDFFLPPENDALLVAISNNKKIRVIELRDRLTNTQIEILSKWENVASILDREQFHTSIWESFKLKSINEKFYTGVANSFKELVSHLEKSGKSSHEAKLFANRLHGRLLFCWFLDKKGFIDSAQQYFNASGKTAAEYYKNTLEALFFSVLNTPQGEDREKKKVADTKTPYLNGGLFDVQKSDWADEEIGFPEGFFVRLYAHFNEFNFTTDESTPEYEQIAIDPEMLGKMFENLLAEINDETGKQARKAKGAFYTPREIVTYMCKESLRQYLHTYTKASERDRISINKVIDISDSDWAKGGTNSKRDAVDKDLRIKITKALDKLTILDPACGSGAFPIGMLQFMLKMYERLEPRFDVYKTKLQIMANNIYGVDIEPMAIEIARLRTFLALVVDQEYNDKKENGGIDTLPNLEFKFVQANSLVPMDKQAAMWDNVPKDGRIKNGKPLFVAMLEIKQKYFKASTSERDKLEVKYRNLQQQGLLDSPQARQLKSYDPFSTDSVGTFYDQLFMHDIEDTFDMVIGNPPYVSTKGRTDKDKATLKNIYGFVDDLYSHFFFRGFELLKPETGVLSYITSKTFWTIQTKRNLREKLQSLRLLEIFDTASPFSAMVDTCVVVVQNKKTTDDYIFKFLDGKKDLENPVDYSIKINTYRKALNTVFFLPNKFNLQVYDKYNDAIRELHQKWWLKVCTSKKIADNAGKLKKYRDNLKDGDVTLLGLVTEGGQGLATANNGRFVGVREGTKSADKAREARVKKLFEANKKYKLKQQFTSQAEVQKYLTNLSEEEIWNLFDSLKEKHGRDIFGQGFIFRIVADERVADTSTLSADEKKNGIKSIKAHFVPYDKGDKDGNRWWLETPFIIDWSEGIVQFLKKNSGKKGGGMPVVRNPQFYFREGFCWSDIHTVLIKSRLKSSAVYDVKSMSMFSQDKKIPDWYLVCLLNSTFISEFDHIFINSTSSFQINDARQIPIIIPSEVQLKEFKIIFDTAYNIKEKEFSGVLDSTQANTQLEKIQNQLDQMVLELYGLKEEKKFTNI